MYKLKIQASQHASGMRQFRYGSNFVKTIALLGSTGSIGTKTLEIVRENNDLEICALSASGKNIPLLEKQIREFRPSLAAVYEENAAKDLKERIADLNTKVVSGMDGLLELASMPQADMLVTAIVGMIGILPTIEAIRNKKNIALANKETLVTAGHIIMPMAKEYGVSIVPIDSEHSAIFQCLCGERKSAVEKLLLTCSGGPFRGMNYSQLKQVQVEDALRHPNWNMGRKITIDSATLVNKGLELMEASWLFGVSSDQVEVVLQPQSIIHSIVQFTDGSILAQMGLPDMKPFIAYALFYPHRRAINQKRLDLFSIGKITFERPDEDTFLGLKMAKEAARIGGSMPTVFNAANEAAVRMFLQKEIGFTDIYDIIASCMQQHHTIDNPSIAQILETQKAVEEYIACRR